MYHTFKIFLTIPTLSYLNFRSPGVRRTAFCNKVSTLYFHWFCSYNLIIIFVLIFYFNQFYIVSSSHIYRKAGLQMDKLRSLNCSSNLKMKAHQDNIKHSNKMTLISTVYIILENLKLYHIWYNFLQDINTKYNQG